MIVTISVYCDNYDNYYLRISRKIMINLLITGNGGSPSASPTTPSAPSVPAGTILVNSLILRQRCKFQIQDANFRMLHLFYSSEICPKTTFLCRWWIKNHSNRRPGLIGWEFGPCTVLRSVLHSVHCGLSFSAFLQFLSHCYSLLGIELCFHL